MCLSIIDLPAAAASETTLNASHGFMNIAGFLTKSTIYLYRVAGLDENKFRQ